MLLNFLTNTLSRSSSVGIGSRYTRHLIAGAVGTLGYMGLLVFFVEIFNLHPVVSTICSFILIEIYCYVIYRMWVYQTRRGHVYSIPRYVIAMGVAFLLNILVMGLTVEVFHLTYLWGIFLGALIIPITNFVLNYLWVFRE